MDRGPRARARSREAAQPPGPQRRAPQASPGKRATSALGIEAWACSLDQRFGLLRSEVRVIEPLDVRQRQAPQVGVGSAFDRIGRAGRRIERQIESVDVPKVVALEEQLSRALRNQIGPHAVRVDRTTVRWEPYARP